MIYAVAYVSLSPLANLEDKNALRVRSYCNFDLFVICVATLMTQFH